VRGGAEENLGLPTFAELRPRFLKISLDLWVPDEFEEFEICWHVRLLKASLRSNLLGYIPACRAGCKGCPGCLYRVAGARKRDFWDANSRRLTDRWHIGEANARRVWYFPPLIECLMEQAELKRLKRGINGQVRRKPQFPSNSNSQSGFDFAAQTENQRKECAREVCNANPDCGSCRGTGLRASHSSPGKHVTCECTAPDSYWRNRAIGS